MLEMIYFLYLYLLFTDTWNTLTELFENTVEAMQRRKTIALQV